MFELRVPCLQPVQARRQPLAGEGQAGADGQTRHPVLRPHALGLPRQVGQQARHGHQELGALVGQHVSGFRIS